MKKAAAVSKAAPKKAAKGKEKSKKLCAHSRCRAQASADGYCRLHYLANWRHIKLNEKIKAEKRLNAFVDRIAKKYPKDFLEKIKEGPLAQLTALHTRLTGSFRRPTQAALVCISLTSY